MHAYVLVLVHVRARQSFALKACARFGAETQRRYGRRSQGNHSPQDPWRVIHLQGHPNAYRGLRCRGARNVAIGYFGDALRKSSRSEQMRSIDTVSPSCNCGQALGAGGSFGTRARASERLHYQAASRGPWQVFRGELSTAVDIRNKF